MIGLEVLALRQQLAVLKRKHPRPHLGRIDRLFWVALSALWTRWSDALILVKPDTVVRWHRAGLRIYWRFRARLGRRRLDAAFHATGMPVSNFGESTPRRAQRSNLRALRGVS